jgi:hypothetical protein
MGAFCISSHGGARMAGKALNKANLMALDRERLAELLLEAVKGDAARQRRVRMALAADQGPQAVAADVRKRFAMIRRGRSYISRKSQKKLGQELEDLVRLIQTQVATDAPDLAFDLLWAQLNLAERIHERTDDSWGTIGDTMRAAMEAIGSLAERMSVDPEALAESVFDAMVADGYGAFDDAIGALAPAMGDSGLAHLKAKAETAREAPLAPGDMAFYDYISNPAEQKARALAARNRSLDIILQDVADQQGDVDAWLAKYTPEQLTYHTIAPDAAARLLDAGRAEEALALIERAVAGQDKDWIDPREMDNVHFACLQALGRTDDLRAALWARFQRRLCPDALRHHLKLLPDFEDIEAADAARQVVLTFPSADAALAYCLKTRDVSLACQVIDARISDIDGDAYEVLTPLAEALSPQHPLHAVLLWRAMIDFALTRGRKGRYNHAARHLHACAHADAAIITYGSHPSHVDYFHGLSERHARKASFWDSYTAHG